MVSSPDPVRAKGALRGEEGFTLIELLAALTILLIGILGVVATLDRTRDAVGYSEVRETAVHRAEREIERLRSIPYADLKLASAPATSTDPGDPAQYVSQDRTKFQWDPNDSSRVADLVTGGAIEPRTTWSDGRLGGTLQVYITRYDDPATDIGGTPAASRVIVGVTVDGPFTLRRPTMVSTVIHEPPAGS